MKEFLLVLILYLAPSPNQPPVDIKQIPVDSLEDCYKAAQKFTGQEITPKMRGQGIIGLGASCAWRYPPENPPQDN